MLSRLRSHVRHNVVGYIALFFALTGVAYAAGPLKAGDPAGGGLSGTYPNPSAGTNTPIAWPLEGYDSGDPELHSTTTDTSRLTAPVAGVYRVTARAQWDPNDVGFRFLGLRLNNTPTDVSTGSDATALAPTGSQAVSGEFKVPQGGYVEVFVNQASGGDLIVRGVYFTMSWVAPG